MMTGRFLRCARFLARGLLPAAAALSLLCAAAFPAHAQSDRGFGDPNRAVGSGGGDLVAQTPTVDGGSITTGASAQIVVLFRNDSSSPITTGAIQLYPSSTVSAGVALNQCVQEPLPPGAVCAIAISVKGLQDGPFRVEMLMRHSGRARLVTAALTGNVTADTGSNANTTFKSDLEAVPDKLDFGSLNASQALVRAVVLRNIISQPIEISSVYIEAAQQSGYSLRTDCAHLEPGGACVVTITWSPIIAGQSTGVLLVEHSGPTGVASVDLTGTFTPPNSNAADPFPAAVPGKGLLVSSQEEINFGSGVQSTSAITVSLVNIGDAPLTITDIRLSGGDSGGLNINAGGCAPKTILEPVQACPLTLTWSPTREGDILDNVTILHDGARGVMVLPVKGKSSVVISQDSKAIRLVTPEGQTISATQTGGAPLSLNQASTMDPASVLDGYQITSHSSNRAIISGSGGSRIVFDKQKVVIGGFLWDVTIRNTGVEFSSGDQRVLLLFDKSLASVNRSSARSSGGGVSSSSTTAASAAGGTGSAGSSSSQASAPAPSASAPAATMR
jgi:hypothetical protein